MMKQFLLSAGLLLIFIPGMPGAASGQIFQKLFQRDKKKTEKQKSGAEVQPANVPRTGMPDYPPTKKKDRYRVDVFASLYMDELVKGRSTTFRNSVPAKALAGISFYEGLKLGADTIKARYKIDVYVHDITGAGTSVAQLIQQKALAQSDLLIGVVSSSDVVLLADFAKKKQVNFVSVLSPSDGNVTENGYFTLLQPTLRTHCDKIRSTARKKFPRSKLILYRHDAIAVDETAYRLVVRDEERKYEIINCDRLPMPDKLRQIFDSTETNVIIMPVLDTEHAGKLLEQLNDTFPNYRFEVFGMPSWKSRSFLKKTEGYNNIAFTFTTPFYFDHTTASGQALTEQYSRMYGGVPNEWVFRGYETFVWYAGLLSKFGTVFQPRMSDYNTASFTRYDIRLARDGDQNFLYHENRHLYLYRYQTGNYAVEN